MVNLDFDDLITMAQASRLLPTQPSPCTLWRWRTKGINGVKLRCIKSGAHWLTSRRALCEFLVAQSSDKNQPGLSSDQPADINEQLRSAGLLPGPPQPYPLRT
jgi:hypothetical protein